MARLTLALLLLATPGLAETLTCQGEPSWTLTLGPDEAEFRFGGVMQNMAVADRVEPIVPGGPQALTLIGRENTAIVVLRPRVCDTGTWEVDVLTQRGQSPIVLPGCCAVSGS